VHRAKEAAHLAEHEIALVRRQHHGGGVRSANASVPSQAPADLSALLTHTGSGLADTINHHLA
jgi:hypothetical protein